VQRQRPDVLEIYRAENAENAGQSQKRARIRKTLFFSHLCIGMLRARLLITPFAGHRHVDKISHAEQDGQ